MTHAGIALEENTCDVSLACLPISKLLRSALDNVLEPVLTPVVELTYMPLTTRPWIRCVEPSEEAPKLPVVI